MVVYQKINNYSALTLFTTYEEVFSRMKALYE